MGLRDLFSFMTTLPVGRGSVEGAASTFYAVPLVGLFEGLIIGLVGLALSSRPLIAGAVMLALHIIVTGGLHLDGTADYGDVIGSRARGEEALRVLKDPRRGSFGVMTVAAVLLVRFASFTALAGRPVEVIISYVASMEAAFLAVLLGRPEPYVGLGRAFWELSRGARRAAANIAIAVTCVAVPAAAARASLVELLPLLAVTVAPLAVADAHRRLGFVNGDVIGFIIETSGSAALLLGALA